MRARWLLLINAVILIVAWGRAEEPCVLGNEHVTLRMAPPASGLVAEFALLTTQRNVVAERGLLQEGFGIGSFYVPGRRLNARLRQQDGIEGTHQIRFSYDCDGPNIRGLNVTRAVELVPDATAFRVTWTVENKGSEDHWIAPWVRNDVCPGGAFDPNDRIDLPSFAGIVQPRRSGYFPAARNWIAVTDPVTRETVFGLFHADHTHSFLALRDEGERNLGFQTAFTPRVLEVGDTWTTTYQIGIVRGLTHIDFASDSIVVQIDYEPGKLILLIGAIRPLSDVEMQASVRADDETVWKLPRKRFDVRPGRLARCTYDWAAPRDGAYEFMALLERDGQAFPLGFDSGSPHGGIDTQFVAGGADTIVMDAWTDAPHALDRRPRTLRRALAAPGDTALWIEDPLHKVFREDVPEATGEFVPTARIALARNEYESFQLVVRPPEGRDLDNVTVQVHDLVDHATGNTIPADKVALFRVGYVPVRVPTHFENPTGQWPDPLIPYAPFRAPGGQCAPLWLTVHAPRDTAPGTYTGLIEIAGAGMEPIELWLEATVWNFELPNTASLKTDFGFWLDGALKQCHRRGYTGAAADLAAAYLDNALAHRVTLRELVEFPPESPDYAVTLAQFGPRLTDAIKRGATTVAVPPSLLEFPEQLRLVERFVVDHHIEHRVFCPLATEPPSPTWFRILERMQDWKEAAPSIPIMVTSGGLDPFIPDGLDIWAVHLQVLDTINNRAILEHIRDGGEVWWFVNHLPPRPYANFFLDFAAIEHRILFWQAWALGVRGVHYWNINYFEPGQDPWANQLDITPANGNGFLVYPGPEGPINSIRWETIRDGIEDYDYLILLAQRIRELEESGAPESFLERGDEAKNLKTLFTDLVSFSRNPDTLLAKRREIAQAIVELKGK